MSTMLSANKLSIPPELKANHSGSYHQGRIASAPQPSLGCPVTYRDDVECGCGWCVGDRVRGEVARSLSAGSSSQPLAPTGTIGKTKTDY